MKLVQELRWFINFQKAELVPTQNLDFLGYHFDLQKGLLFPTQKKLDRLKVQTVSIRKSLVLTPRKLMSLIGEKKKKKKKNSTSGKVTHETFSVVPKVTLEVSPVTGQKDPSNREFSELSQMVGGSTKSYGRCSYPSSCSQHFGVYRCLPKRLGSSLERNSPKWPLVKQGGSASHQRIAAKSCSSGPKGVSGALSRSKRAHLFRQQYSSILSEQRRRHPFHRNVCSYLENSGIHKFQKDPDKSKTCTWIPKK